MSACVRMALAGGVFWGSVSTGHAESTTAVLPVPAGNWVYSGSATHQVAGDTLHIDQQSERAILNWQSFNVGENNAVNFQQPSQSAIALNRIGQNDPSQILGKITADGQIYLYNQNGFIFGKDSVINTHTLVATTLNVADEVIKNRSIVTEYDTQNRRPAFAGNPDGDVKIDVRQGARINIDKNGRLIMVAPNIHNAGDLHADKHGQIILVASHDRVYLQPAAPDSPFAGLLVEVDTGGQVTNVGNILARQGNVTLAGFAVNQNGRVRATTSVNVNGSVRLLAREGEFRDGDLLVATRTTRRRDLGDGLGTTSKVSFGDGGATEIVADADAGTAIDEQLQPLSRLEVSAHTVHFQAGSRLTVPGGNVKVTATGAPMAVAQNNQGRIIMDSGAVIDVSGSKGITVDMERNVVEHPVQSFELRDAPNQKGGVLHGRTVRVDIRREHTIVDISGALARIERGIDERLGRGGAVNFVSSGDVVINDGATVDISGGTVNYRPGYINTTKLLTDHGQVVDIADALPGQRYRAIYGLYVEEHPKWGIVREWQVGDVGPGRFEPGYQRGMAAGSFNVQTTNLAWGGELVAGAAAGIYQRTPATAPFGGLFSVDTQTFSFNQNLVGAAQGVLFTGQQQPVTVGVDLPFPAGGHGRPADRPADLVFSSGSIKRSGVDQLVVNSLGAAKVEAGVDVAMAHGGRFEVSADGIQVDGNIDVPGGTIILASGFRSAPGAETVFAFNADARLNVAGSSNLDVSGRWVNDFALGIQTVPTEPLTIDGGTVILAATGELATEQGAMIAANGGAWYGQDQQLTPGLAGSVELRTIGGAGIPTTLRLEGGQSAYGLRGGGTLLLESGKIVIGEPAAADLVNNPLIVSVRNNALDLPHSASFGNVQLHSNFEDIVVKADTTLGLVQRNLVLDQGFANIASARSVLGFSEARVFAEHARAPVNLTLNAANDARLETGAQLLMDKQAAVTLAATLGGVHVDGLISAPAGTIALTVNQSPISYDDSQGVWLGGQARLTVAGTTRMNPVDSAGHRTGQVLDGGRVMLTAERGYVVVREGAQIDLRGTRATLDLPPAAGGGINLEPVEVGSNAGQLQIIAAEGAVIDGRFQAGAGTATTRGGQFNLALNRAIRNLPQGETTGAEFFFGDMRLAVRQDFAAALADEARFGDSLAELGLSGRAQVSAEQLTDAGFADIRLATTNIDNAGRVTANSSVTFLGDVELAAAASINLDTPSIRSEGLAGATDAANGGVVNGGEVKLDTAYFRAGSSVLRVADQVPETGTGTFTVRSKWLELEGASHWNGFADINLNSEHDLRVVGVVGIDRVVDGQQNSEYRGELVTAANLNLTASQVYPSTLSRFTFTNANNPEGKITISTSGNHDPSPLSAGGELSFKAPVIEQNGTVRAPFGSINMTAGRSLLLGERSLTSVSGAGQIIPFGTTFSALDWIYPIERNNILVFEAPPEKNIVLSSPELEMVAGSRVDLSGGGDLLAYEFQPGIGGSFDYLAPGSPSYRGGFAIVPGLGTALAPYDHLQRAYYQPVGSQVYLAGTDTLAAGYYTILPPRYALLPGAFLITPMPGKQDMRINTRNEEGLPIVPGYRAMAGAGTRDPRWHGFLVESGADVRRRSHYDEQTANAFFSARALAKDAATPPLPMDSGQLSIRGVQTKLTLAGDLEVAAPAGGRGARMDIAADRLRIVETLAQTPTAGVLEILADDLSGLRVDSLLLGGERRFNRASGATAINVTSSEITFGKNAQLRVADLTVAATGAIRVEAGATIKAEGTVNTGDSRFETSGDGALLRVSADRQVQLQRSASQGARGELDIQAGSLLSAARSILVDASQTTNLDGDIQMRGGSLNLSANAIHVGEVERITQPGLKLANAKLLGLGVDDLVLNSRTDISFVGQVGVQDQTGALRPLSFKNLVLNAAGLRGFGDAGHTASIQADRLELANPFAAPTANGGAATGSGRLALIANDLRLGDGVVGIDGFDAVSIAVANGFRAVGSGTVAADADLNLSAAYFTAIGGNALAIDATGHSVRLTGNGNAYSADPGYGGSIGVVADAISLNADVVLPSGQLRLHGLTGDVLVGGQARIDLSGDAVRFADVAVNTPGGLFSAVADQGKVSLAEGSRLDLNPGGADAAGGTLILKAARQQVGLHGQIAANGGSVVMDVGGFAGDGGFDQAVSTLMAAGISDSVYIRVRDAAIEQTGGLLRANAITLVADRGAISIGGRLSADGVAVGGGSADGGTVRLYGGDEVSLRAGGRITANGAGALGKGGEVMLSSTDADQDLRHGIAIGAGASIDVGGAGGNGEVVLTALRTDGNGDGVDDGVAIRPIQGEVTGHRGFYADAVKTYRNQDIGGDGRIEAADIERIRADTEAFMSAQTMGRVGGLGGGLRLRPGVAIAHQGDLVLAHQWDLVDWRYTAAGIDAVPGALTIAASGSLTLAHSLTDGFRTQMAGFPAETRDILQNDASWSYRLTAGADLASADPLATAATAEGGKDLTLGGNTVLRTGTGDIRIAASGDLVFQQRLVPTGRVASIYTAGRASPQNPHGTLHPLYVTFGFYGEYPIDGGDLWISAGGDIKGGLDQSPYIHEWLVRQGQWSERVPTAWAINFTRFDQNVGLLGGGNLNIHAGGNIEDLGVAAPTTGKQVGRPQDATPFARFETNEVQVNGHSTMRVTAGGDIAGGLYFQAHGQGSLLAGGNIKGSNNPLMFSPTLQGLLNGPQLLLGDTQLALAANREVSLSAVTDPMILNRITGGRDVNFFSYSDDSALSVTALTGDVVLNADTSVINARVATGTRGQARLSALYPASLGVVALGGDILVGGVDTDIVLFPSARAELNLFAKGEIAALGDGIKRIGMSGFDPALLPSWQLPSTAVDLELDGRNMPALLNPFSASADIHALVPLHRGERVEPVRIATEEGDIRSVIFNLPKRAIIAGGRDLNNVSLSIQHANVSGDASVISSARDIIYHTNRLRDFGTLEGNTNKIEIGGPGNVLIRSGRNIDLGTSIGISTVGNTYNPNLPANGAHATVLVGLNGREPDYLGLLNLDPNVLRYAQNYGQFQQLVTAFMRERTGNTALTTKSAFALFNELDPTEYAHLQPKFDALASDQYQRALAHMQGVIVNFVRERQGAHLSREEALAAFRDMPANDYLPIQTRLNTIANSVLFSELTATGAATAADPTMGNERGFAAINALFPLDRLYNLLANGRGQMPELLAADASGNPVRQDFDRFVQRWSLVDGGINAANAAERFKQLAPADYLSITSLIAAAEQEVRPRYLAMNPINPDYLGHEWNGDLNLFFSKLQTIRGGSINMVVPGGGINAGLAVIADDLAKLPADLGIVAQGQGHVNAFLSDNFVVNQSRVFTLAGGDILVWSSVGDIDAGRGAKSAIAAPPPIVSFDQSGNLVITFPPITSGSGIRTAAPIGGETLPGDVSLFAPGGVVDAGEAGIAGFNVTIAATAVLGANNIQVGGVGTGVPAAPVTGVAAGFTGTGNVVANVAQMTQATADMGRDDVGNRGPKLGVLDVDLIGFGEIAMAAKREEDR